jgi:hypothetical protein
MMDDLPEWMQDFKKRDVSLILFAVENAEAFRAIAPNHPLTIHCLEMKWLVESANAVEARDKQKRGPER